MQPPARPTQRITQRQPPPFSQNVAPPSSFAAIVQNYSNAGEGLEGRPNKDAFQLLVSEILSTVGSEDTENCADDMTTYYMAVQVVINAGLESLFNENRADESEKLREATNSLLVIRITLQRMPGVLFFAHSTEINHSEQQYLYLWLLPRLVSRLGNPKARPLVFDLEETIEAMFVAAASNPEYWQHLKIMMEYCREILNCEYNHPFEPAYSKSFADL